MYVCVLLIQDNGISSLDFIFENIFKFIQIIVHSLLTRIIMPLLTIY